MLSWFWNLFKPKVVIPPIPVETPADVSELYSPRERNIYSYFDGDEIVECDPMLLWKKLMDNGPELSVRIKVAFSESKGNIKAHTELVKQIRDSFGVKSFEDGGLTEVETVDLLNHFLIYVGNVKKNSNPSQIPQVEETLPTSNSPTDDSPPSENGSGCTLTEKEPGSVKQEPSPLVLESHLGQSPQV